jgi:hypothetical protein
MKYYTLTTCYLKDHDLCMIDHAPDKIRHISYKLSEGGCVANEYPRDQNDAVVYMDEKWGMLIGGLVSNTSQFLIVCSKIKDLIAGAFPAGDPDIQNFPVSIYDHKKRLASSDYWFVNPLGAIDCLDLAKSEIKRGSDGDVIRVKRTVLSRVKLRNQRPLFRPKENPRSYIIRHDLLMAIKDLNLSIPNIYVEELEVTGAAE